MERGEQRLTFEQTTSLFALAMSDVLMINLDTRAIGQYNGCNYGLLKVIFDVNLQLFEQKADKKLLFVLRDFDPQENNEDKIKLALNTDLQKIWDGINKPFQHQDKQIGDFFKIEYEFFADFREDPDEFRENCDRLRERFEIGKSNSLFESISDDNVPIDGLDFYFDQAWQSIRENKQLNLPDQRKVVAEYRCETIKSDAFHSVLPALEKLQKDAQQTLIKNFKEEAG